MDTHHYWLPVSSRTTSRLVRHAFRGRRWQGRASDTSVCGVQCAMVEPSELDWFQAPTCWDCTNILIEEQEQADATLEQ